MRGGKTKGAGSSGKADSRLAVKRKAAEKREAKKVKAATKDPNKPKRPPSAFFIFLEEFRKQYRENNSNKSVAAVGKAGGVKWRSMSESEKAPYVAKAEKRKADYNKSMAAYNKKDRGSGIPPAEEEENESDKSKSEVHDGEDEERGKEDDE